MVSNISIDELADAGVEFGNLFSRFGEDRIAVFHYFTESSLYLKLPLTFFDVASFSHLFSEHMVKHCFSGFEPGYFPPGHQRQTDKNYSSSDKHPSRMPDREPYQDNGHQQR
jgi:hypothetical protein